MSIILPSAGLAAGLLLGLPLRSTPGPAPGIAQWNSIVALAATTQVSEVSGAAVQAELDAAVASGQSSYTLPAATINLSQSLQIRPGTKNFILRGQQGTRLVRASNSDFPLIMAGVGYLYSYENSAFADLPQTLISSVQQGTIRLDRVSGSEVVPGWYAIIGTDGSNDIVRHKDGQPTFCFKRELVRVLSVSGNQVTIDRPVGRSFEQAELRQLQIPGRQAYYDQIIENVTIQDLTLSGTSSVSGVPAAKVLRANCFSGLTLKNLNVNDFSIAGISIGLGNGASVSNVSMGTDAFQSGYGIEFLGTRFVTVRQSNFRQLKAGVIFQAGTQDALVEDCRYEGPEVYGFDVGHGQGEQRITYRRCIAPVFSIANPSWRRGVTDVVLENCSATAQMNIYGNARNVRIFGKHPLSSMTAPIFCLFSEGGGSGIPSGNTYPISVTLDSVNSSRSDQDGVNLRTSSISGIPAGVSQLVIRNSAFENRVTNQGVNLRFRDLPIPSRVEIQNCQLSASYAWSSNMFFGDAVGTGRIDLIVRDSVLSKPGPYGVHFSPGTRGTLAHSGSAYNGSPVSDSVFENLAAFLTNSQGLN